MQKRSTSLGVPVVALSLWLGGAAVAGAGNNAMVDEASSGAPASGAPGAWWACGCGW